MSSTDSKIFDLIEQWEASCEQGVAPMLEELCADCPELIPVLTRRIEALRATEWMNKEIVLETERTESQPPPKKVGRYELIEIIGKGGFAEVWKANDPELDRLVAVKLPKANANFHSESFLEEARKVAKLRHPAIVSVHDVGRTQNKWFIVSELIESGSLAARIRTNRPSHDESVRIVMHIAEALHYAHRQGFIHRDIKPQNILIDENGSPKITDFGIALSETLPVAQRSRTAGTLAYMSPEQGQNQTEKIDARTDIYSLGVVLYELLTGRLPFVTDDAMELFAAVLSQAPRTPRTIDQSIPVEIERLCLKAIAKNPADRFSTAQDFADELRKAISPTIQDGRSRLGFASVLLSVIATIAFGFWWLNGLSQKRNEVIPNTSNVTDSISGPALSRVAQALDETKSDLADLQKSLAELPAISGEDKTQQEASAELAAQMGYTALASNDMAAAFVEFNRAIELNDRLATGWYGRGVVHFNQGKFAEATADLKRATTLETQKPDYFKNLAFALTKVDQHDEAVQQIIIGQSKTTLAEREEYKRFVAQVYHSRACQRTKNGYTEGALADVEESIRWDDSYSDAYDDRGTLRYNWRKFDEALADFTKAIELDPNRHDYYVHRGHALTALGRNTEAQADYETARQLERANGK